MEGDIGVIQTYTSKSAMEGDIGGIQTYTSKSAMEVDIGGLQTYYIIRSLNFINRRGTKI